MKVADEMRKALQKKLSRQIYLLHDLDVVIKKNKHAFSISLKNEKEVLVIWCLTLCDLMD